MTGGDRPVLPRAPHVVVALAAAAVVIAAVVPFLPALDAGFSDFDDHGFLIEVDGWRGLGAEHLGWMFTTTRLGHYQPLTYLTYAIDYAIFGLEPSAFHAVNIAWHAAGAVLVFVLIFRILRLESAHLPTPGTSDTTRCFVSATAAAAWAAHPLRVESVAWITERRDVVSCALLAGAALAYLAHGSSAGRPGRGRWWWTCLGLLALSLLAKAWGITFFAVALLMDVRPLRRLTGPPRRWLADPAARAVLIEKLPLLALGLIAAAAAARAQTDRAARSLENWGPVERLVQSGYGLWFYVDRTVAPRRLSLLYELPDRLNPGEPRWLIPMLLVLGVAILLIAMRRRWTGLAVAATAYAVLVSPVLGLLQSGAQLVADRYAHIPTIPLFAAGACGASAALARIGLPRRPAAHAALAALALGVIGAAGVMAWNRASLWRSDERLWTASIAAGIDGPHLRNLLANHLEGRGRLTEAEEHYRASVRMRPSHADSWFGLGTVLNKQKRPVEAAEAFRQAAAVAKNPAPALMMLGIVSISQLGRPADATAAFRAAVEVTERLGNPERTGRPYLLLAAALGQSGDETGAIPLLRRAAEFPDTRAEAERHLRDLGLMR